MNRHASLSLKGFTLLYFIYTIRQQPIHDFLSLTVLIQLLEFGGLEKGNFAPKVHLVNSFDKVQVSG